MNPVIRPADMEDFETCSGIAERAWRKGYGEYRDILGDELFGNIFPGWEKAKAESMEPYFRKDTGLHAFKIVMGDSIAGFITCRVDAGRKVGVICNNAVEPGSQGKGLGSMMYEFILDFFREKGMTAAEVSTMKHDAYLPARKAYEKAGFSRKLERLTYYKKL